MIIKIPRDKCLARYPLFPTSYYDPGNDEQEMYYPKVARGYVLSLPANSFRGHISRLANGLLQFMASFETAEFIFLGDSAIPWLYQQNSYPPALKARQYLLHHKVGKKFNGGLIIDKNALPVFIRHLCWLTRCNASLPVIYFCDEQQRFMANICKYGNLHIDMLDKRADELFQSFLGAGDFIEAPPGGCFNRFHTGSRINGREMLTPVKP